MFMIFFLAYVAIAFAVFFGFAAYFRMQNEPMGALWFTSMIWPIFIPVLLFIGLGYVSHRLAGGR